MKTPCSTATCRQEGTLDKAPVCLLCLLTLAHGNVYWLLLTLQCCIAWGLRMPKGCCNQCTVTQNLPQLNSI